MSGREARVGRKQHMRGKRRGQGTGDRGQGTQRERKHSSTGKGMDKGKLQGNRRKQSDRGRQADGTANVGQVGEGEETRLTGRRQKGRTASTKWKRKARRVT